MEEKRMVHAAKPKSQKSKRVCADARKAKGNAQKCAVPTPGEMKEDLHPDLVPYLMTNMVVGRVLRHPLIFATPYLPEWTSLINEKYASKLQYVRRMLAKKKWSEYVWVHERPHRLDTFYEIMDEMSDKQYWQLLGEVWIDSENLWQYGWMIDQLLNCGRADRYKIMDKGERDFLAKLPPQFTIYRGHQGKRNKMGWSWSLSYFKARWFSERFRQSGASVIRATVNRDNVIAYFGRAGEYEIVVDPDLVTDVKTVMPTKNRRPWVQEVLDEAWAGCTLPRANSFHGLWHWEKVERNALLLAKHTPKADKTVAQLFALVHDSKRENEDEDPEHGERAGEYVETLYKRDKLQITVGQKDLLVYACKHHEKGQTSDNPTIGVCWDADRLDLTRVGITPDPNLLSTQAGKEMIWTLP